MTDISTAGLAAAWAGQRVDARQQALEIAFMKQQAESEKAVVALLEAAMPDETAAAPPGQGQIVDIQA